MIRIYTVDASASRARVKNGERLCVNNVIVNTVGEQLLIIYRGLLFREKGPGNGAFTLLWNDNGGIWIFLTARDTFRLVRGKDEDDIFRYETWNRYLPFLLHLPLRFSSFLSFLLHFFCLVGWNQLFPTGSHSIHFMHRATSSYFCNSWMNLQPPFLRICI